MKRRVPLARTARLVVAAAVLCGCGKEYSGIDGVPVLTPAAPSPEARVPGVCLPTLRDEAPSQDAPTLSLHGDAVVEHRLDEPYEDAGAQAWSVTAEDLSDRVEVTGLESVDVHTVGDYWVHFRVRGGSDPTAPDAPVAETSRLIRVTDGARFARQTARPVGSTPSPLGYFEHLPATYTAPSASAASPDRDPSATQTFPLIIYNHGIGEAYDWIEQDDDDFGKSPQRLDRLLRRGLPALLHTGVWDDALPFIVLSPQGCSLELGLQLRVLRAFVTYAMRTYRVDPTRVYWIGFSAGSYITWEYTLRYSEELAAAIHLGGGDSELFTCPRSTPPVWAFHARNDYTVPLEEDRRTLDFIDTCSPREPVRLTILRQGGHEIDTPVLDGTAMHPSAYDPTSDPYDQNIYAWLLQRRL